MIPVLEKLPCARCDKCDKKIKGSSKTTCMDCRKHKCLDCPTVMTTDRRRCYPCARKHDKGPNDGAGSTRRLGTWMREGDERYE